MMIDGIWMVSFHELFQFLSDTVRLSHQPLAFLFALLRCYLHLVTATDGVLIVDDELLALALRRGVLPEILNLVVPPFSLLLFT